MECGGSPCVPWGLLPASANPWEGGGWSPPEAALPSWAASAKVQERPKDRFVVLLLSLSCLVCKMEIGPLQSPPANSGPCRTLALQDPVRAAQKEPGRNASLGEAPGRYLETEGVGCLPRSEGAELARPPRGREGAGRAGRSQVLLQREELGTGLTWASRLLRAEGGQGEALGARGRGAPPLPLAAPSHEPAAHFLPPPVPPGSTSSAEPGSPGPAGSALPPAPRGGH